MKGGRAGYRQSSILNPVMPDWVREHILINILADLMRKMENAAGVGGLWI